MGTGQRRGSPCPLLLPSTLGRPRPPMGGGGRGAWPTAPRSLNPGAGSGAHMQSRREDRWAPAGDARACGLWLPPFKARAASVGTGTSAGRRRGCVGSLEACASGQGEPKRKGE